MIYRRNIKSISLDSWHAHFTVVVRKTYRVITRGEMRSADSYDKSDTSRWQARRPRRHCIAKLIENSILRANSCGLTDPFVRLCPMDRKTTDGTTRRSIIEAYVRKVSILPSLTFDIFQPSRWNLQSKSMISFTLRIVD